jgi:peptide/nickel transport system permease protein
MPIYLYIARRVLFIIPLLFGITLVAFIIANAIPADPINANIPANQLNNKEIVDAFRKKWGLDKSPPEQYIIYVTNLLHGDFGVSMKSHNPVSADIQQFLPATAELATFATIIGVLIGVIFGVVSAVWYNKPIDFIVRTVGLLGVSVPIFVLALLGLAIFHGQLGWAAGPGRISARIGAPPVVTGLMLVDSALANRWDVFRDALWHLALPSVILALYMAALISRVTRSAMLEVLSLDYMRTARSKGLSERVVVLRHAFSNALMPVVTVIGLSYGNVLSGAVLTESIFAWPGIGRYMFRASTSQDFPAIMGGSILIAVIYVAVNLIVDILYYFLDPRIRSR